MSALDIRQRQRLGRLLGMLGSDHDGEAVNAGRLAVRLIRDAGLTWEQVLRADAVPEHIADPRQGDLLDDWPTHWADAVGFCRDNIDALNERSRDFVAQLTHYRRQPSERQLDWLRHCVEHLQRTGGEGM